MGKIRGVNLGGWLVYEKWMQSPYLANIESADDYDMVHEYPYDYRSEVLDYHRANFITERDFRCMAEVGVDAIRIPVPYYLFGTEHHAPCVEYLDKAMDWAEVYSFDVLIDLHTVPMSQNAFDNGGYTGMCRWHMSKRRVEWTLDLLGRVASRYAGHKALWGLQPLNEPVPEWMFNTGSYKHRREHPDRISVSSPMPFEKLWLFYELFIDKVRPILGDDIALVLHDRFEPGRWYDFQKQGNIWFDMHKYAYFKAKKFPQKTFEEYEKVIRQFGREVEKSQAHHPTIVGEWCLATAAKGADTVWLPQYAKAQLDAWDKGEGGFFWSYRVDKPKYERWSFLHAVNNGWIDFSGRQLELI